MKIKIITTFSNFHPGYSLTGIVQDQAKMLTRYGHDVSVVVSENFDDAVSWKIEPWLPADVPLVDYNTKDFFSLDHEKMSDRAADLFVEKLSDADVIFTHDLLLTGWNLPFFMAILNTPALAGRWYHWLHSLPRHEYDWWWLEKLPGDHFLVSPNRTYQNLVAEAYHTTVDRVKVVPHIKDIRVFLRFCAESWEFIDDNPAVLHADVVQIYPAGTDRLDMKRLREIILIFAEMKKRGFSICLVCANQWATGKQPRQNIQDYYDLAWNNGLTPSEFIFTSEWRKPEFETGLPQHILRDLYSLGNVFIFPTWCESFGLVLPEASLASGCLPVINRHLSVLPEVTMGRGLKYGFGSFEQNIVFGNMTEAQYFSAIAGAVLQRMRDEESVATRSIMRQSYNLDTIYNEYYWPLLSEGTNDPS